MARLVVAVAIVLAGCSIVTPTANISPSPTPSPAQTPGPSQSLPPPSPIGYSGPLAIITSGSQWIGLVSSDGQIVAHANVLYMRFWFTHGAIVRASLTRVYYLRDNFQVGYLKPDGSTGTATKIPAGPNDQAQFAVSPDDKRIAVTIFSYGPNLHGYNGMRMYVEDLNGGGNHVEIFSSPTIAEYPIGWVGGHVIIAVSDPWGHIQNVTAANPYGATVYHVADATNGDRLASLCDDSNGPVGFIQTIGTMCWEHNGSPTFLRWDSSAFPAPAAIPNPRDQWTDALSPDGTHVAVAGEPVRVYGAGDQQLPISAWNIFGWLDATHFVYQKPAAGLLSVYDTQARLSLDILGGDTYQGTVPVAVS